MNAWIVKRAEAALSAAREGNPKAMDRLMRVALPFNRPHRISVAAVTPDAVEVGLPWRRSNQNHLGGMHACAIATALEFASGASVMIEVGMRDYRIIMSRIEVDYLAKPKGNCVAKASRNTPEVKGLSGVLEGEGVARITLVSDLYDAQGDHCAQAHVHWHLKVWGGRS
jgi:acyl-coenzyme A thioesterase PaaI-like protein